MFTVIVILALVVCVVLAFAVLIKNPKGGGLSGTFGGTANQLFGYKRTSDDIEKITWGLGIGLMVLCLASVAFKPTATINQANTPFSDQAPQPASDFQTLPSNTEDLPAATGNEEGSAESDGNEELPN